MIGDFCMQTTEDHKTVNDAAAIKQKISYGACILVRAFQKLIIIQEIINFNGFQSFLIIMNMKCIHDMNKCATVFLLHMIHFCKIQSMGVLFSLYEFCTQRGFIAH